VKWHRESLCVCVALHTANTRTHTLLDHYINVPFMGDNCGNCNYLYKWRQTMNSDEAHLTTHYSLLTTHYSTTLYYYYHYHHSSIRRVKSGTKM